MHAVECASSRSGVVRRPQPPGYDRFVALLTLALIDFLHREAKLQSRLMKVAAAGALPMALPDRASRTRHIARQGSTFENPGSVEIGRSPLDSRAAAAIAGSGVRMGGTAW